MRRIWLFIPALCVGLIISLVYAVPELTSDPATGKVHGASDEGKKAIAGYKVSANLKIDLWAAEPLTANIIAFCFDDTGKAYVAETFRLKQGVSDNRAHMYWLDDDLASRTVADRVAMYRKHLGKKFPDWEKMQDRVRVVWSKSGTGPADQAEVFADGFKDAAAGLGSGVLAYNGGVYYTCIPDLWFLQDTKNANKADVKKSLSTGHGVHVAFIGHDSHGLVVGPDGKVYFSIGDRGLNIPNGPSNPDSGAVLRCDPDGRNLELVARGLRNPQELAFDAYGNLFTWDNNSDSGDQARWVFVQPGGDSGWRLGYQYGSAMHDETVKQGNRGPWNYEKLWHTQHEGQAAYVLPPLLHFGNGPSGICYYPGTGLGEQYTNHFFACDFKGSPDNSLIWTLSVKPKGAAFEVVKPEKFAEHMLPTDCCFGPDGGLYWSDWVNGWDCTGKGRIYRITNPEVQKSALVAEVKKLLNEGMAQRSTEELVKLLGHVDMRVRQNAQFALVAKGKAALPLLTGVARANPNLFARLHALWGLGQLGRTLPEAQAALTPLLTDADEWVRINALRVASAPHTAVALKLLADPSLAVRREAALALARVPAPAELLPALQRLLTDNADRDAYLRHAAVQALAASKLELTPTPTDVPAVRRAYLLAERVRGSVRVADYLNDAEVSIVVEAGRAIHDLHLTDALPQLAALSNRANLPTPLAFRVVNAHFRLGQPANAQALAAYAARSDAPEVVRTLAVKLLGEWAKPSRRDAVTGLTQDLPPRAGEPAAVAFRAQIAGIFAGPTKTRSEAAKVAAALGIKEVGPVLFDLVADAQKAGDLRREALGALATLKDNRLNKAIQVAMSSDEPRLRAAGRHQLALREPATALKELAAVLAGSNPPVERQAALATLAEIGHPEARTLVGQWLEQVLAKTAPAELQLDILEAAEKLSKHGASSFKDKLAAFEQSRSKSDDLANYREALVGGDAANGQRLFMTKAELSCLRCHKLNGQGGEVGPEMAGIGAQKTREYLLEAIVLPNKQIAQGYETAVLTLTNGKQVTGIPKGETPMELKLVTADGQMVTIKKAEIDERQRGQSAMPADLLKYLSKRELRDIVEFLATLKQPASKE